MGSPGDDRPRRAGTTSGRPGVLPRLMLAGSLPWAAMLMSPARKVRSATDVVREARPAGRRLTVTVVICAYTEERWSDVEDAVDSVRRQSHPVDEIVLVSDHNPTLLDRAQATFPDVTCVMNADVRGLAGARNTGVAIATGDVVAFLDDDAVAASDWAMHLIAAHSDDDVIGVGGAVLPAWDSGAAPAWFPAEFLWVVGCSYVGLPTGPADIRNPIGANMSFLRSAFATAGGFSADMGRLGQDAAGCEETEFSIRARRTHRSGRIVLEPDAVCFHRVPEDRATRRYFRRRCWAEGRSKAVVSELAGADMALASERSYVSRVLPLGILRGLGAAARGELAGAARAWTILEGTLLTSLSYLLARARQARRKRR